MTQEEKAQALEVLESILDDLDHDIWLELKNSGASTEDRLERLDIMDALTLIQQQVVSRLGGMQL